MVTPAMYLRHAFYVVAGALALGLTWPYAFDWMSAGGNILDPRAFFGDAIDAGGSAAFLGIDMLFAWAVFMVWVVTDARKIGLGTRWGIGFILLSYIGVSMAFPVYLVTRERFLARRDNLDEAPRPKAAGTDAEAEAEVPATQAAG